MTENLLVENKILKDRLEHISDLIIEQIEEPSKDSLGLILKINRIAQGKVCSNCRYWSVEEQVCVNAESEHRADFTLPNHTCLEYEARRD